jgi:hypothetical protein
LRRGRKKFGLKEEGMTEERGKLHNLYYLQNIVKIIKSRTKIWAGHVANKGEKLYKVLIRKPHGKIPLKRPKGRWEDIKMDTREDIKMDTKIEESRV